MKKVLVGLLLTAAPMAASAADGWQFAITPYAWVPGMSNSLDTRFGTVSSSSSSSNALSSLDIAFMGAIEARHDRWSIIGDLLYTDLSQDFGTKFDRLFDGAAAGTSRVRPSAAMRSIVLSRIRRVRSTSARASGASGSTRASISTRAVSRAAATISTRTGPTR